MKKSLLMMACALTAWSASAQLYVCGNSVKVGDQTLSWDAKNALQCNEEGDYYTFEALGEFTISTVKADWDAGWKTGSYTLKGGWDVTETAATCALQRVDGNIPAAKAGEMVTYKVKKDYSSIEATFSAGELEEYYALHGDITGNPKWESTNMTLVDGKWTCTLTCTTAGNFGVRKMVGEEQVDWIGGNATVTEADKVYSFVAGNNSSCSLLGEYTVVFDADNGTIEFQGGGQVVPPVETGLFLTGSFNAWATSSADGNDAYAMVKEGDVYTCVLAALAADTEFKVKTDEDGWLTSWGAEGDPSWTEAQPVAVTPNVAMNAWAGSGCNFLVAEDLVNVTVTFVKSADASVASTLTVSGTSAVTEVEAAAADVPAVYYNLQGMVIANPEAGQLYIVNRAGKITKEIVR